MSGRAWVNGALFGCLIWVVIILVVVGVASLLGAFH